MRKRILAAVYVNLTCSLIYNGCEFKNSEEPVKPVTVASSASLINRDNSVDEKPEDLKAEPAVLNEKEIAPHAVPLTVIVDNLQSQSAPVEMSFYGPDNKFLDTGDQKKKYRFKPKNGKLVAKIKDLSYGEFAVALYQDINSDGKIDKNVIGIPEEPYAFSNNYKPVIKAPSFKDCRFEYNAGANTINISLIK